MAQVVGTSVPRVDGRDKVTGHTEYTVNLEMPGMLYGKILRSVVPHAKITRLDVTEAEKLPGVVAVLTGADLQKLGIKPLYGSLIKDQPIVALDRVRYVGDSVAAVAAVSEEIAEQALELIEVEYEELPAVFDPLEALEEGAPLLHETEDNNTAELLGDSKSINIMKGSNLVGKFKLRKGDVDQGFAESDFVFEDEFTTPAVTHAHLEPHVALAYFNADGSLEVWSATQTPSNVRNELANLFRLPLSQVRVRVPALGGGYGGKCYAHIEPVTCALARKARRPVKITLSREEVFMTLTKHAARIRVKTGVKRDGTIVARQIVAYYDTGAYADVGPRVARNGAYPGAGPYRIPHVKVDAHCVYTNKTPAGAYRGYGVAQVSWAVESHTDMVAERLGMDPLQFRLLNGIREGDPFHTGEPAEGMPVNDLLQQAAEEIQWQEGFRAIRTPDGKLRGKGIACSVKGTGTPSVSTAILKMDEDGSVEVLVSTVEIGQGSSTVLAQIAADSIGVPMEKVRVVNPDTAITPYDRSTSSSRSTFMMGNAIIMAAQEIRHQLFEAASDLLEVSAEDLELADGIVSVKGSPDRKLSIEDIIRRKYGMKVGSIVGRGTYKTEGGLDPETGQGRASAFWETGVSAAEVEVDPRTGEVKILKFVSVADVGKVINPMLCEGQVEGTILTGIGHAFYENIIYEYGQPINPNFLDYGLPSLCETPQQMKVILAEHLHPKGPYGAHGVGETVMPSIAPCIANAIYNAVGVRIHDLPITPEKVLRNLVEKNAAVQAS